MLLLVMHHIAADGWSVGILRRELGELYKAGCAGGDAHLPELPVQYGDFARWQREWLQDEVLERHVSYWRRQMEGAPVVLELPTDRPRPAAESYRGGRATLDIPVELTAALHRVSREERVTLFTTLLAAFQVLLYRHSGQEDIVVGTPNAGRNRQETEPLIGCFVNTLVLRSDLSDNPSFRTFLRRVWNVVLEAHTHHDLPFEKLVEELRPVRSLSHHPLFQVMFVLQNASTEALEMPGLTVTEVAVDREASMFDLTLLMRDTSSGLSGTLEYNCDLFDASTMARLLGHLRTILESVVADRERRVGELPVLTPAERDEYARWNQTATAYPSRSCLHELFERQVLTDPERVAAQFEGHEVSYQLLDRRSNQLARYLKKLGVGPEVLVGICLDRSLGMIVGLLGVLKAGGAYVPLDPAFPPARLGFMLADAGVSVLLSEEKQMASLPVCTAETVCLDRVREEILAESPERMACEVSQENLAYVIYTSGSTGRPKGVEIEHGAIVNFLSSMKRIPGLEPSDILLSVTTLSFDIAGLELFLPLVTGARTVLVSGDVALDGTLLAETLAQTRATVMQATPATGRLMIEAGWRGDKSLKALCGGEALSPDLAEALLSRCGEVWNMYGPTETTVWSSCARIISASDVHVGRPIANTEIQILDSRGQVAPIGVTAELLIGGDGLARGYHDRSDLTAERFVPHPFQPGHQLYRTGDLAKYRADGNIECLGRLDDQVKVRGFRIETGEVEARLDEHSSVQQSVVVARDEASGERGLVAYVVLDQDQAPPTPAILRAHMREQLPAYMMPSRFVMLATLPLTPNGKVDRKALPALDRQRPDVGASYAAPRTQPEEELARIWSVVLGIERVGVNDNFFDIGGSSLLAVRIFAMIEETFGRPLPLASLFQHPTVAELATLLESAGERPVRWDSLVAIRPGEGLPLFFVHGAGGNVLIYRDLARNLAGC